MRWSATIWLVLLVLAACSGDGDSAGVVESTEVVFEFSDGDGVTFEPLAEDVLPALEPTTSDQVIVELVECVWLGDQRWGFRGHVGLPPELDRAEFVVTMGWYRGSDIGTFADYSGQVTATSSGHFEALIGPADTRMEEVAVPPRGSMRDTACELRVGSASTEVVERFTYRGPTSETVAGPRPSAAGRLPPGPVDPVPLQVDLMGSFTGFVPDDPDIPWQPGYVPGEPAGSARFGPGVLSVDGTSYRVTAETPFVNCAMLSVFLSLDAFAGAGASAHKCYVIAGLSDDREVEWLVGLGGEKVEWNGDPEWAHALQSVSEVRAVDIVEIRDDVAIVDGYLRWFPLPLATDFTVTCDQAQGETFQPWDLAPPYVTEGRVDAATGEIIEITCPGYFSG